MKIIEVKNISYRFKQLEGDYTDALKNVSFSVEKGEFLVIAGHNGSGKSTLAKHLNGLFLPSEGEVYIKGILTADEDKVFEIRSSAGMVFQNPDNQMVATFVEDDIAFGPENLGVPREEIEQRIDWALSSVGMEGHRKSTPQNMSGGQKQRIAIASVLAMKPEILILDEATSMLDPKGRGEVMETIKKLHADGITIIHVTHNMEEAFYADRIIVMRDGRIAMEGSPADVFSDAANLIRNKLSLPPVLETARLLNEYGIAVSNAFSESALAEEICRLL